MGRLVALHSWSEALAQTSPASATIPDFKACTASQYWVALIAASGRNGMIAIRRRVEPGRFLEVGLPDASGLALDGHWQRACWASQVNPPIHTRTGA